MPASARTAAAPRREKSRGHHAAFRQRVDVHGVAPVDGRTMLGENSLNQCRIARQARRQWAVHMIGSQGRVAFDHGDQPTERHPVSSIAAMNVVETSVLRTPEGDRLLRHTFGAFRFGAIDPTVHLDGGRLVMTSMTPVGPAWTDASTTGVTHGGEGRAVICRRNPDPCGLRDTFSGLEASHSIVARLQRDLPRLHIAPRGRGRVERPLSPQVHP